jgi:hypothetical protein
MMSEPKKFLARWSARKLASRTPPASGDAHAQQEPGDGTDTVDNGALAEKPDDRDTSAQSFDPAQLPSLDSIGPDSDIAAFLRRDVPPELTRAALRRAWTSDPAIKNFVGLVESGWDFNDPAAMSGFGPISPEEVARLAGNVIAALPQSAPANEAAEVSTSEQNSEHVGRSVPPAGLLETPQSEQVPHDSSNIAAQQNESGRKS